ncbi:MAG: Gfo/Idh/MocA family protein [Acidobacteriota bacterium]
MQNMTRRSVLAGITASAAFGSQANSTVSVGIIGTGNRGRFDGAIFANDPRARIAALSDLYPERIDEAKTKIPGAAGARVFKDYRELLAQPDIDAVLIATPVWLHPEHFEAAVKARKHIYCEKPAGADVAGVKRLLAAAREADPSKSIAFGFQQRKSPEYLAAERIVRSGQLGALMLMKSSWIVGSATIRPFTRVPGLSAEDRKMRDWWHYRETSGDIIVEQNCHGIDVLNWFSGAHPLSAIGGGGRGRRTLGDNLDDLSVTYNYPGNLRGWLLATQIAQGRRREVCEQFFGMDGFLETTRLSYLWQRTPDKVVRVESKREITVDAVEEFLSRIVSGRPENMAFAACESTFTALLGRLAIDLKREVTWDELLATSNT